MILWKQLPVHKWNAFLGYSLQITFNYKEEVNNFHGLQNETGKEFLGLKPIQIQIIKIIMTYA